VLIVPIVDRVYNAPTSNFARVFGRELADQLARLRWLRVVPLETTERLGPNVTDFIDDSDGCYVIERSVLGVGDSESAEIRLLRYRSRELIWTEVLVLHDEAQRDPTVARLVARIATRIEREEQIRAARLPEDDDNFRNLIWRGRWHMNRLTSRDAALARAMFDRALALAPNSPEALTEKAIALAWEKWAKRAPRQEFYELSDFARRIMLLDPDDCRGYWLAGIAEGWLGNHTASIALLRRAIDIAPSFEPAHAQLGTMLNLSDRPEEALQSLHLALKLSPNDTHLFFRYNEIAISWLQLQRYDLCIEWSDRALILRPGYWYAQAIKIHALVETQDWEGARKMGEGFHISHPNFSQDYLEWVPFSDRAWVRRLSASLRLATRGAFCQAP